MSEARGRITQPIDVRLYSAEAHLRMSRELLDTGRPIGALFYIGRALIALDRVREKLDGDALL
jgi:hypothetical protein